MQEVGVNPGDFDDDGGGGCLISKISCLISVSLCEHHRLKMCPKTFFYSNFLKFPIAWYLGFSWFQNLILVFFNSSLFLFAFYSQPQF
uniref:Uncharacterized protein n=1 Tax=Helianthus annuus TaxID=4232 RepID=A0A251SVH6_HELAN